MWGDGRRSGNYPIGQWGRFFIKTERDIMRKLFVCIAFIAVLISGCGSVRPQDPPAALQCNLEKDFAVEDIYEKNGAYRNITYSVLSLSAGGEFGAYGAGFLMGWQKVGEKPKPISRDKIDVVTGVSTGAILATHAFLKKDEVIKDIYLSSSGRIYKDRLIFEHLFSNSLYNTSGKDALIERNLTTEIIDEVKRDETDRGLYIGLVNLDTGKFVRVDMKKLAKGISPVERRDACYRAVIGASSAIPVIFEPKFIDGDMWVDGGARRHLFITGAPEWAGGNVARRLFSFVHGDLAVRENKVKNGIIQIAGRTAEIAIDQGMKDSIRLQERLALGCPEDFDCGSSGRLFETFYVSAASAAEKCCKNEPKHCEKGSDDIFSSSFMKCLAERGIDDGEAYAQNNGWQSFNDLGLGSLPDGKTRTTISRSFVQ